MGLFDLDAERAVLGAVLADEQCFDVVLGLLPDEQSFFDERHKIIFSCISGMYEKGQAIDLVTVSSELQKQGKLDRDTRYYLGKLTSAAPVSANAPDYAETVKERYLARCIVEAGSKISKLGEHGEADKDTLQDIFFNLISKFSLKENTELIAWVERQKQINSFELDLKQILPLPLYQFLLGLSKHAYLNFPIEASFTFLLPILAGLAGTKFRVSSGVSSKYCLLWSMVVMDSSIGKTDILGPLKDPLDDWEKAWLETYEAELKKYNSVKKKKKLDPEAQEIDPPVKKEILLQGATMEGVKAVHKSNPKGMVWVADEIMTVFHGFDQYKAGKGADESVFLEMLSGGSSKVTRVTGSTYIPEMAISGTGGIQPEIAYDLLRKRNNNNGLWGRFLFYSCDIQQTVINEQKKAPLDLTMLNRLYGYFYKTEGKQFDFENPAQVKATSIYLNNEKNEAEPSMKAYIGKAYHFFLKISIILHLIDSFFKGFEIPPDLISEDIADNAFTITNFYIAQAEKLFGEKAESEIQRLYKKINKFVEDKGGEATLRDIQRGLMRKNSALEVETVLKEMQTLGFGYVEKKGKSIKFLKGEE